MLPEDTAFASCFLGRVVHLDPKLLCRDGGVFCVVSLCQLQPGCIQISNTQPYPTRSHTSQQKVSAPETAGAGTSASLSMFSSGHLMISKVDIRNAFSLVKTEVFKICGLAKWIQRHS